MGEEVPERARDAFIAEYLRQRAGARKLRAEGKCENSPECYSSCEFSAYCSEWKHTVRAIF